MIREELILDRVRGKKVLDVGSVGQTNAYNLFSLMKSHCASIVGVDLPECEQTLKKSFNCELEDMMGDGDAKIVFANMESAALDEKFDVIVLGDVIEHVFNPGKLLSNLREHLNDDGELIITTPNAKWPTVFCKPNPTHVLWHDRYTLAYLLEQHDLRVKHWRYYFGNKPHYSLWKKFLVWRQGLYFVAVK